MSRGLSGSPNGRCRKGAAGIAWVEAGDAAEHPRHTGQPHTEQEGENQVQNCAPALPPTFLW